MKTTVLLLCSILASDVCALAALDADIPSTNRVTLSSKDWMPSAEDTQKGLVAVQAFLEKPVSTNQRTKGEIEKIKQHIKKYRVQFIGIVRDGKKIVRCNFFPLSGGFDYWRREEVRVEDGGFWFWQIDYEPGTGKCLNFKSNGYA